MLSKFDKNEPNLYIPSPQQTECKTHRHCGHLFSNPQKPVLRLLRYFSAVSNVSFVSSRHDPDSSRRPMNACSLLHHPRSAGHQPNSCLLALSLPPSIFRVVCRNKLPSRSTGAQLNEHVAMHCAIGLNGFYRPASFIYAQFLSGLPFSQPRRGSPARI